MIYWNTCFLSLYFILDTPTQSEAIHTKTSSLACFHTTAFSSAFSLFGVKVWFALVPGKVVFLSNKISRKCIFKNGS